MTTMQEIKTNARKIWAAGEYGAVAQFLPPASAHLVNAARIEQGQEVLDVGCGTGVTSITAARTGAMVKALDLTPDLLAVAEDEAALAGLDNIQWKEGDAEALPYTDAQFDCVVSSFGHMFTPDPAAVTAEMLRVTKSGGTIAFTTWPPGSVVGQMLKAVGAILPPPPGAAPPPQWGIEATVMERLGAGVTDVKFEAGAVAWPTLSPGHMWNLFSGTYGPFVAALGRLADQPEMQEQLAMSVKKIFETHLKDNVVHFEYLLTVAKKV